MDTSTPTGGITGFTERPLRPQSGGKKRLVIIVIVLLILAGLGFMAFRQFQAGNEEVTPTEAPVVEPTDEPEPTQDEEVTPTASASAAPTRRPTTGAVSSAKDLNVQVLNGSGAEGAAGGVRDYLKEKGYKNLSTGNADNFDYEDVTVRAKASRKDLADTVVSDLKGKYTVNATVGTVETSSEYDVLVIVGK